MKKCSFLLLLSFNVLLTSAQTSTPVVSELYDFMIQLKADFGSLSRFYTVVYAPQRSQRFIDFFEQKQQRLQGFDFDALSVNGQVDYTMTLQYINDKHYQFEAQLQQYNSLVEWVDAADVIYELEAKRRRGHLMQGQLIAEKLTVVAHNIQEVSTRLIQEDVRFVRDEAIRAKRILLGQQKALRSVYSFYENYDPNFTWWVEKPYLLVDDLLGQYASLIRNQVDSASMHADDGSGIIGRPIGKKELLRQLKKEMIPYGPDELVAIANKEFAWCDSLLLIASAKMGFGTDWRAAQEQVKQSFVPPGQQPQMMLQLYKTSVEFLKDKELISIPPLAEETWRMSMISPERQLISPFFLGGELLQISYPTKDMNHEDKMMSMRGNNPHFAKAVIHHELIAGHHLQFYMNERNKSYRNFYTPFWTEGWALYWEMLLWDKGFAEGPEDEIGMLFWRMHRCARIIFSLNYHLGKWTPQQCIDFLVDRVGHERANAEGEVRRSFTGGYGPLYQIAYMVGGLQFRALYQQLVVEGKWTDMEFHDAVLKENAMPVEMLRAILTQQRLEEKFETKWRFYKY